MVTISLLKTDISNHKNNINISIPPNQHSVVNSKIKQKVAIWMKVVIKFY